MTGLPARPAVPGDVERAVRDAVERVLAEARAAEPEAGAWRFSGRWFSAHPIRTRARPGA